MILQSLPIPLSTIIEIGTLVVALGGFIAGVKYLSRWIKERDDDLKEIREAINLHHGNSKIHIDPDRDGSRWQELNINVAKLSESMTKLSDAFIAHRASFEAFLVTRTQPPKGPD